MSSVYDLEPPTRGRVQVQTCAGPLDVELWPREAPRACRNFVQLCLEGYYDGSPFHRLVKGLMVQGGDPTGTGRGGASAFGGAPFADEFHSRLQFRRRGLVACAGAGTPDSNGSQFFVTLGRCDHLNGKHTIFGTVTGDSLYNLLRLGERDTDSDDRPTDPPKILGSRILENPFEDVQPRPRGEQVGRPPPPEEEGGAGGGGKPKRGSKRPKAKEKLPTRLRMNMLSFGDDEEYEGYEEQAQARDGAGVAQPPPPPEVAAATHAVAAEAPPGSGAAPHEGPGAAAAAGDFGARMRAQVLEKKRRAERPAEGAEAVREVGARGTVPPPVGGGDNPREAKPNQLRLKRPRTAAPPADSGRTLPDDKTSHRRRTGGGGREDGAIARLERPGSRAERSVEDVREAKAPDAGRAERMDLPAAWRVDDYLDMEDGEEEKGGDLLSLRAHVLTFAERPRRPGERRDGEDDWDDYEVVDPLLEKGKEAWKQRQGERGERHRRHRRHHDGARTETRGDDRDRAHRGGERRGSSRRDRGHRSDR